MSETSNIQELYDDQKSRNFVNHLIRAYLPVYKAQKVWEFPDPKKEYKCNVCNHKLIDLGTVIGRMNSSEEYMKDTVEQMRKSINGEEIPFEDKAVIKHITHGAIMAWTGEKTTTFLCGDCIKELLNFVTTGLLMGDKNITWIVNQTRRSEVFSQFKETPSLNNGEKQNISEIEKRANKKKMTFGDLEVLQELKKKMEKEK